MKRETAKKAEGLTVWILIFSITGLALVSFLPWISTAEDNYVEGELYFNYEMMSASSNTEIKSLAGNLTFISILFWALILLCLISFICITFHASLKSSHFGQIAMALISLSILVLSILVVYSEYNFIRTAEGPGIITLANIVFHIKYAYIPIVCAILLLVCSIYYTTVVSVHCIKQYKSLKEGKNVETTPKEEPIPIQTKPISPKPKVEKKRLEMEDWLAGQAQASDKKTESPESHYQKEEIPKERTFLDEEKQTTDVEEKAIQQPFPVEETKIKPKETDEVRPSQSFEKALAYAIEKKIKKPETEEQKLQKIEPKEEEKDLPLEQKPEIEEPPVRKIKVRCPQCKNVFLTELEGEHTRIKCPTCGKEGVIKQQS